jgi:hypothetical protein
MKTAITIILGGMLVLNFMILLALGAGGLVLVLAQKTQAEELSPLDFYSDYDNFEATVGSDVTQGRYLTYHYEFAE